MSIFTPEMLNDMCDTYDMCDTFYLQITSKLFLTKSSNENTFLHAEKFVPLRCI